MSALSERYEDEWIAELGRRGVQVNGATPEEQRQQKALAKFTPVIRKSISWKQALALSAAAYAKAKAKGRA